MYIELQNPSTGNDIAAGYSPITFSLRAGVQYDIYANDWNGITFQSWSVANAVRNPISYSVTSGVHASLTAFYTGSVLSSPSASRVGIVVPMYMYPNSYWNQLVSVHQAFPGVSVLAIINPSNGPVLDSTYQRYVSMLQSSGIVTYGYVDTMRATVSVQSVEQQISEYANWYHVAGIFLDNFVNVDGYESYYSTITSYAHKLGLRTMGNPGWSVAFGYVGTVDNLVIYETNGLPTISYLQSATGGFPSSAFSFIATKVASVPAQSYVDSASHYVSYVWITNYGASYANLPSTSYFDQLMSELSST
jgi:hypothetical protein